MSEVWENAPVAGTELLMLLALADMCNEDRECWPSVRHLMHKVRVSEAQARRLIKALENKDIIHVQRYGGKGAPGRESSKYRITSMTMLDGDIATGITHDTTTGIACDTTTGITHDTLKHHNESSIETKNPQPPKGGDASGSASSKREKTLRKGKTAKPITRWTLAECKAYEEGCSAALAALRTAWGHDVTFTRFTDMSLTEQRDFIAVHQQLDAVGVGSADYAALIRFVRDDWQKAPVSQLAKRVTDWRSAKAPKAVTPSPATVAEKEPELTPEERRAQVEKFRAARLAAAVHHD